MEANRHVYQVNTRNRFGESLFEINQSVRNVGIGTQIWSDHCDGFVLKVVKDVHTRIVLCEISGNQEL